jgi:DNA recombination protein RmuC
MKQFHSDVEQMLRTPQHRGSFGEQQLETILADQLPPDMYGVREAVVGNRRPDAYVETTEGVVCIDSKFPLEAFERYVDADGDDEAERHRREFARAVESQLDKIRSDYVRPEDGTAEFAFAFIPSERVYYHLVAEEYDLLRAYAAEGVQVVSPLTLTGKLDLVRAGVHARRLSEQAEEVQSRLRRLARRFDDFGEEWSTFRTHIRNAKNKADDADAEFGRLREEFDRIEGLSGEKRSGGEPIGELPGDEPANEPE